MPSWDEIIERTNEFPLDTIRADYISKLAELRDRNVICYYSGWLQKPDSPGTEISDYDMNGFMNAIHGLDRDRGLDLILHTPGGIFTATEAIVEYLRECFKDDIVAIVPQLAMSAGTMIACSCREIIMGRQSSIGPTDPQLGGVAAGGVIDEFNTAIRQIEETPESAVLWTQIIGKYHPTFLGDCQMAVDRSKEMVRSWLLSNMHRDTPDADLVVDEIVGKLCEHGSSAMHDRHFSYGSAHKMGLVVSRLEDNDAEQDAILTIHHSYMTTFSKTPSVKIIENNLGKRWIIHEGYQPN